MYILQTHTCPATTKFSTRAHCYYCKEAKQSSMFSVDYVHFSAWLDQLLGRGAYTETTPKSCLNVPHTARLLSLIILNTLHLHKHLMDNDILCLSPLVTGGNNNCGLIVEQTLPKQLLCQKYNRVTCISVGLKRWHWIPWSQQRSWWETCCHK